MAMKEPSKAAYKAPHKTVYDKEPGNMEKIVLEPRRMAAKKTAGNLPRCRLLPCVHRYR